MVIKTITVTEDAYEALKKLKHENESFSQLFKRLGDTKVTVNDIFGLSKSSKEESDEFLKRVSGVRKNMNKDMEKRMHDVRSRLKRAH